MFDYQRKMESSDGDFVENLRDSSPSVDLLGDGDGERERDKLHENSINYRSANYHYLYIYISARILVFVHLFFWL